MQSETLQVDEQRRAAIAAHAVSVGEGLRWPHLLTLAPTLIVADVQDAGLMHGERLLDRGEPLPGLGERAASFHGAVRVLSGAWLLSLSVRRRHRGATDLPPLLAGARRAVALLPQSAEVAEA
jgi:hypothetical protein